MHANVLTAEASHNLFTMARNIKGRPVSSVAKSLILGAGSILNLSGGDFSNFTHSSMARQDRDYRSIRSDWERIAGDLRGSMDKLRRNSGLKTK